MDWQKLLAALAQAGLTQDQIAAECGVAQSTVSDLNRGVTASPSFDFGSRLIALKSRVSAEPEKAGA